MTSTSAILRTDGGARGNPGPAAAAFVLETPAGEVLCSAGRFLGDATNNVAEYEAVIWGLEIASARGVESLTLLCDSELVVRQLLGTYRVKNAGLRPLHDRAMRLLETFVSADIRHVRREQNAAADALVNEALDVRGQVGDAVSACGSPQSQPSLFDGDTTASPDGKETGQSHAAQGVRRQGGDGVYELTVRGHFDAAHALRGYPGECRELHGHTWDIEVTVEGAALDDIGIVYDFKTLKDDLSQVLAAYDHAYLNEVPPFDEISPTAENLARVLYESLVARVGNAVRVSAVAVWESPVAKLVYRP